MEEINTIEFKKQNNNLPGLTGNILSSGTISLESGIISFANGVSYVDHSVLGAVLINGANYNPLQAWVQNAECSLYNVGLEVNETFQRGHSVVLDTQLNIGVTNQRTYINNSKLWQRNINILTVSEFLGNFLTKYPIEDYINVYNFLIKNQFLTNIISNAINQIEKYFDSNLVNITLKEEIDPEDENGANILYLLIHFSGSVENANKKLLIFQNEWLIPNVGSKISLFNVDII